MVDDAPSRRAAVEAAGGDREALATLLDLHGGRVLAICRRLCRDEHEAEDLCQEVFLKLMHALPRYDPARSFRPWLMRVAANACLNHLRARRRRPTTSLDAWCEAGAPPPVAGDPGPVERAARRERHDALHRARARLSPDAQTLLALRYEGGLGQAEISAALGGVPLGTVKVRLHRARKALARHLRELGADR